MKYKKRKTLLLTFLLIFVNLYPVYAKESPKILVNHWAINEISDAQLEGIIKSSIISKTEDFTKDISEGQLKEIVQNTNNKLESYNLRKNPNYQKLNYSFDNTSKNNIANIIFDFSLQYDESANGKEKISYLRENKILNGNGTSINLNKKCSYEEAVALFKRTADNIIFKQNKAAKGMFYKTEKNGNTVYIFGSIHIGDNTMYPIDKKVLDSYNSSDELYVEVNLLKDDSANEKLSTRHTDGKTLKDDLGAEKYSKYKKLMDQYQIPESIYIDFKPWVAYNFLSNMPIYLKMPYASSYGVDLYFLNNAARNNKPIKELESTKLQLDLLADFDSDEYIIMIDSLIENLNSNPKNMDRILNSYKNLISIWKSGNSESLNRTINKTDKFTNNLFDKRDIGMAEKIDLMLKSTEKKTYFVVAGSAHFTPEDSVIKLLETKGYKIERIK